MGDILNLKIYINIWFHCIAAHSMEEAEVLCDRLGIFVDGNLQCIGNPKEVRYIYTHSNV